MPSISLPSPGQKPWNLNPAITALNDEMETGRLSVDALSATYGEDLHVAKFGAVGDGTTDDTTAILAAIDVASGRRVVLDGALTYAVDSLQLPNGAYLDGNGATLIQKNPSGGSAAGAVIRNELFYGDAGSPNTNITVKNLHVRIGSGSSGRPVSFSGVDGLHISGLRITKEAGAITTDFMLNFRNCKNVLVDDFRIDNPGAVYEDGLHITACQDMVVTNGIIRSGDDSISITQELSAPTETRNVSISNVQVYSQRASFIKVLVESGETNGIRDVTLNAISGQSAAAGLEGTGMVIVDVTNSGKIVNLSLSHITIDGTKKAGNSATFTNVDGLSISDMRIWNAYGVAAYFTNCDELWIDGLRASHLSSAPTNDLIVFSACSGTLGGLQSISAKNHGISIANGGKLNSLSPLVNNPVANGIYVAGTLTSLSIISPMVNDATGAISFDAGVTLGNGLIVGGSATSNTSPLVNPPTTLCVFGYFNGTTTISRIVGNFGAFGAATTTRPTVTGSRGANAALASLLTALATLGWVTDSSS